MRLRLLYVTSLFLSFSYSSYGISCLSFHHLKNPVCEEESCLVLAFSLRRKTEPWVEALSPRTIVFLRSYACSSFRLRSILLFSCTLHGIETAETKNVVFSIVKEKKDITDEKRSEGILESRPDFSAYDLFDIDNINNIMLI